MYYNIDDKRKTKDVQRIFCKLWDVYSQIMYLLHLNCRHVRKDPEIIEKCKKSCYNNHKWERAGNNRCGIRT